MFDSSKVERQSFKGGFPETDYTLELNGVEAKKAGTGTWQVSLDWRIRGVRYDNLPVWENLSFTDNAFAVTLNKIQDAGLPCPVIKTASPQKAAEEVARFLANSKGHTTSARVYEELGTNGTQQRHIRHYN
jgi:hypothetical protein